MLCISGKVCISLHELGTVYQLVAFLGILRDEMYCINLNCFYCYALRVNKSSNLKFATTWKASFLWCHSRFSCGSFVKACCSKSFKLMLTA